MSLSVLIGCPCSKSSSRLPGFLVEDYFQVRILKPEAKSSKTDIPLQMRAATFQVFVDSKGQLWSISLYNLQEFARMSSMYVASSLVRVSGSQFLRNLTGI